MEKKKVLAVFMLMALVASASMVFALERRTASTDREFSDAIKDVRRSGDWQEETIRNSVENFIAEDYNAAQSIVEESELVNRFILWTRNGENVMWGEFGSNNFVGEDNHGKKAWGIYYNGFFAGFYDGEFFYGKYSRNRWLAIGLFGLEQSNGEFKTFSSSRPRPLPEPTPNYEFDTVNSDKEVLSAKKPTFSRTALRTQKLSRVN